MTTVNCPLGTIVHPWKPTTAALGGKKKFWSIDEGVLKSVDGFNPEEEYWIRVRPNIWIRDPLSGVQSLVFCPGIIPKDNKFKPEVGLINLDIDCKSDDLSIVWSEDPKINGGTCCLKRSFFGIMEKRYRVVAVHHIPKSESLAFPDIRESYKKGEYGKILKPLGAWLPGENISGFAVLWGDGEPVGWEIVPSLKEIIGTPTEGAGEGYFSRGGKIKKFSTVDTSYLEELLRPQIVENL